MRTLKAGCFLVDVENKCIALIHREKQDDYSFPKGHVEEGGNMFLRNNKDLVELALPKLKKVGEQFLTLNKKLERADMPMVDGLEENIIQVLQKQGGVERE